MNEPLMNTNFMITIITTNPITNYYITIIIIGDNNIKLRVLNNGLQ